MLHTYKAVLRGNRIEWDGAPPEEVATEREVAVYVTILEEPAAVRDTATTGQAMAAALEHLAGLQARTATCDPIAWEREVRGDRDLPGRDA